MLENIKLAGRKGFTDFLERMEKNNPQNSEAWKYLRVMWDAQWRTYGDVLMSILSSLNKEELAYVLREYKKDASFREVPSEYHSEKFSGCRT